MKSLEDVRQSLLSGDEHVVDARAANRFAGSEPEFRQGVEAGHIPGSANLPYGGIVDAETGTYRDAETLSATFAAAGIDERPVITTCGSGVSACILGLGMHLLGNENWSVYDGSWTEWGSTADTRKQRVRHDQENQRQRRNPAGQWWPRSGINYGIVNPPVYHASTVTSPTLEAYRNRDYTKDITYGRMGTPTQKALEEAVALVEGGDRAIAVSSGLASITTAVSAFVESGDHILVTDSAYFPTRNFCNNVMKKYGVETTYYDPLIGVGIADLIQNNTKVVMTEAPGSQTFEVQDIPAIAEAAHARGAVVINDNTWGTPINFKSFDRGVDVSVHAATKYIVGHSDAMLGIIVTTDDHYETILKNFRFWGQHAAPDDCYLGLRGLRSMSIRLKQHQRTP